MTERGRHLESIPKASSQPRIANLAPGAVGGLNISYETDNSGDSLTTPTSILVRPPKDGNHVSLKRPAGDMKGSYGDAEVYPVHTPL